MIIQMRNVLVNYIDSFDARLFSIYFFKQAFVIAPKQYFKCYMWLAYFQSKPPPDLKGSKTTLQSSVIKERKTINGGSQSLDHVNFFNQKQINKQKYISDYRIPFHQTSKISRGCEENYPIKAMLKLPCHSLIFLLFHQLNLLGSLKSVL